MRNLKRPSTKNKVSKSTTSKGGKSPQYPAFSFVFLTTNNSYTFDYFNKDNDKRIAIENVYKRLVEIGKDTWLDWYTKGKQQGLETIPAHQIKISPSGRTITQDEKVIVFRVKNYTGEDARILGIKEDGSPILHIIGFDFNYSVYNHG